MSFLELANAAFAFVGDLTVGAIQWASGSSLDALGSINDIVIGGRD